MYEHRHQQLLPKRAFIIRVVTHALIAFAVIVTALFIGVAGYHWIGGLSWIDALLNAAMILTGMGPMNSLATTGAKLFASAYALFSGIVFLSSIGIVVAPIAHRILHWFHLDESDSDSAPARKK